MGGEGGNGKKNKNGEWIKCDGLEKLQKKIEHSPLHRRHSRRDSASSKRTNVVCNWQEWNVSCSENVSPWTLVSPHPRFLAPPSHLSPPYQMEGHPEKQGFDYYYQMIEKKGIEK